VTTAESAACAPTNGIRCNAWPSFIRHIPEPTGPKPASRLSNSTPPRMISSEPISATTKEVLKRSVDNKSCNDTTPWQGTTCSFAVNKQRGPSSKSGTSRNAVSRRGCINVCDAPLSNKTCTLLARPRFVRIQAYARGRRPCNDSLETLASCPLGLATRPDLGPEIGAFSLKAPQSLPRPRNNDLGRSENLTTMSRHLSRALDPATWWVWMARTLCSWSAAPPPEKLLWLHR